MSSTLEASVFMGKNYSDNCIPSRIHGKCHFEADVRDTWKVDIGTIRWDFWSVSNQLWKFSIETLFSGQWWRSHQSLACKGCLGKVNQNPTSNTFWEEPLGWLKDSPQYRTLDTIDGEPMEFEWNISQDSLHCSSSQNNPKDELSSCRCSMTSFVELKTMNMNFLLIPHLCLLLQKDFQWDVGHSSDLDQKRSGILLTTRDHKENGTESLNWWLSNSEKAEI